MIWHFLYAKCVRDCDRDERRVSDRRELNETGGRVDFIAKCCCGSQRRLRLADTTRTGNGNESMLAQKGSDLIKLIPSTDKARQRERQICTRGAQPRPHGNRGSIPCSRRRGTRGSFEGPPMLTVKRQRSNQQLERLPLRRASITALESADPVGAETCALGEGLLRETRREPVTS